MENHALSIGVPSAAVVAEMSSSARALENEKDKPLVCDALAADLAGARALKQARMRAASLSMASSQGHGAPSMPGDAVPKPRVTRLVMRTLYFDDALRVALGQHHRAQAGVLRSLAQEAGHGVGCSQVVLLGAGMDTRAWRLPLASSAGPSDDGVSTDPRRTNGGLGPVDVGVMGRGGTARQPLLLQPALRHPGSSKACGLVECPGPGHATPLTQGCQMP
ncbi:uncharacterized protein HaLaN_28961 [Haematococcus lacustris]|uniref:Uncharacterized protein n=1 Tax=Haematococcus lacustris TaxID=44745 RepID=A0A6A0ACS0_HAELA|nr:uncharacterized protein HaLaN_28961 [Haematococcus lacustris]